jgi:hypothetical protein
MTGQQLIDATVIAVHGIGYLRFHDPVWGNPEAYMRLAVVVTNGERHLGPWGSLFDRRTQEVIGEPTPQDILIVSKAVFDTKAFKEAELEQWTGALDPADTR